MSKRTHRPGARPSRAQLSTLIPDGLASGAVGHRQERLERILLEEIQRLVRDEARDLLRARLAALLDLKRLPKLPFAFVGVHEPGAAEAATGGDPWHA